MGKYSRAFDKLTQAQREEMARKNPAGLKALAWEVRRERGRESLWYFDQHIAKNPVTCEALHKPICQRFERSRKRKRLVLLPRGHVKSNLFNAEDIAREIACDQNVRILIASHKMPDAEKFCGLVKQILESPSYRETYPEVRPAIGTNQRPISWSKSRLLVHRTGRFAEATVETASADAPVVGRHFNRIKFDDIVTQLSVANPELIQNTTDFVEHCEALLDPGGIMDFIGTRYDYADEYGRILDTPALRAEFEIIDEWKAVEVDGVPIFPTRFTMAPDDEDDKISIPKLKRTHSVYFVNSQYYNEPVDPSAAMFKESDIQMLRELPALNNYVYFRVCDLSGEGDTESYTAIVTGAVDQNANIYITDIFWGQYTQREICDELFQGQRRGPKETWPEVVGFEPAPFERSLRATLDTRMMQEKVIIPYVFLDATQAIKAKDERIKGIHWWFSAKKFYLLESCRNKEVLIEEFIRWPRFKRKDVADATAQIPHIMWPAGVPEDNQTVEDRKAVKLALREKRELDAIYNGHEVVYISNDRLMPPHVAVFGQSIGMNV